MYLGFAKLTAFISFAAGMYLVLRGFFMTATTKGLAIMLLGVGVLVVSLFLYNKSA